MRPIPSLRTSSPLALATAAALAFTACAVPSYASSSYATAELPAAKVDLAPKPAGQLQTAVFAAGCFWCVEAIFEQLDGVTEVVSGYAGGDAGDADYKKVSAGGTKHAESVRVTYDPGKITYGTLLRVLFATQDPTTLNRQGPDAGTQYRSAIFVANDEEKKVAAAYIAQLDAAKLYSNKITTSIEPLGNGFFPAEEYHQDFVARNPDHPYVRGESVPRASRTMKLFPKLLKKR
jgi:peptide-methionine (S)-S-oxide reductase